MVDDGHVLVGVHTDHEHQANVAAEVLEAHEPVRTERNSTVDDRPDGI